MKRSSHFLSLVKYSIIPAVAYCITVFFFLRDDTYSMTWLLYLGNGLFMFGIFISGFINSRIPNTDANFSDNGMAINIVAIVLAVVIIGIMLAVFLPGTHPGVAESSTRLPPTIGRKTTGSLVSMLILNALIGNFIAGSIATLLAKGVSAVSKDKDSN